LARFAPPHTDGPVGLRSRHLVREPKADRMSALRSAGLWPALRLRTQTRPGRPSEPPSRAGAQSGQDVRAPERGPLARFAPPHTDGPVGLRSCLLVREPKADRMSALRSAGLWPALRLRTQT